MTEWMRRTVGTGMVRLSHRLMLLMSEQRRVVGVELSSFMLQSRYKLVFFGRVQRALELIALYEPRRLDRIRRDVRMICGISGGPNHYQHVDRMIMLSLPGVLYGSPAELAMTIIHEATHGRIIDRGIQYDVENRDRIEAACVRQEAAFARCLPGGEALADAELAKLERPWWSDQSLQEGQLQHARAEELPSWFIRMMERSFARRAARAAAAARR